MKVSAKLIVTQNEGFRGPYSSYHSYPEAGDALFDKLEELEKSNKKFRLIIERI